MSNAHEMKPIDAQSSSGETDRSLRRRSEDGPGLEHEFAPRNNSRKASWKDDLRIIPTLTIMYFLNVLDRTAVPYSIDDTAELLGTAQGTSDLTQGIFYAGFILFVLPTVLLLPKIGARFLLPALSIGFGAMTMIQAAASTWAGLAAVNFFLGAFQAGFWAATIAYLSNVYERHQLALRFAIIYGMAHLFASFNRIIAANVMVTTSPLAGWQLISVIEGAVTVGFALIAFVLLPRAPETAYSKGESVFKLLFSPSTIGFVLVATFLGASATSCEATIYDMITTLSTTDASEGLQIVSVYTSGFIIVLAVAASSDFYRERSTHVGAIVAGSLISLVNITTVYYINMRASGEFSSYILAPTVFIAPVFDAWFLNRTASASGRVLMAGLVVTAYNVGEMVGWASFIDAYLATRDNSHGGTAATAKRTLEAYDLSSLMAASGFMAAAVMLTFALGAWHKRESRKAGRVVARAHVDAGFD